MASPNTSIMATSDIGRDLLIQNPAIAATLPHVCVCICTYKRPELLARLLNSIAVQETDGKFTYSAVIVDNDVLKSAKAVVAHFAGTSRMNVAYCLEPRQNIALARNRAILSANGDFVALIDDDEFPERDWLLNLFIACDRYQASGVLGPVKRHFDNEPPKWILKGKFYDRPTGPSGSQVKWGSARTGNVLLKRSVFAIDEPPFRPEFRAGEDQDFFRRMIDKGHSFVWCNEAVAYEVVPEGRWKRSFMLKQALLRGATARLQPTLGVKDVAKSLIAVPLYLLALPFALVLGHHWFMTLLVKICDHAGKLLALAGINTIKAPYVTG
jgi:succinoglycan biosynthesis protein ExoM